MQVSKQQLELYIRLLPNRKKEYIKAVYCHPAYLTYYYSYYIRSTLHLVSASLGFWLAS